VRKAWETPIDFAIAGGTAFLALVVYLLTLTVTVPFWDSGEYIATSYILGIPHPPGTPLYVLLGRVFCLLPIPLSIAGKVNLLSALPSALACGMTALLTARLLARAGPPFGTGTEAGVRPTGISRTGGVLAGLVMAFSNTFWINAIEAEVYALSSLVMVVAVYLMLQWHEMRRAGGEEGRRATNLVVVIFYMLSLSIAFHMGAFVVFLPLVLFFLSDYYPSLRDPRFVWSALTLVVLSFFLGFDAERLAITLVLLLVLVLLNVHLGGWKPFVAIGFGFAAVGLSGLLMAKINVVAGSVAGLGLAAAGYYLMRRSLVSDNLGFWIVAVFILGLSVHLYLPIRASLDPAINEADPSTLKTFYLMLSRDQYKPGPPWEFNGGWETKFNTHFWRYWRGQYDFGVPALWGLPFVLGLTGAVLHAARARRSFLLMAFVMLATSIGLIWHLNFSPDEVRDRDYFFVALFHFFTVWVGMGAAAVLFLVRESLREGTLRRALVVVTAALLLLVPVGQLRANWFTHDRSKFTVARDYAYNILTGLEPNSILFTNGDNDTFPLWYLQEVEQVRKDVRVACLSLLNTDWYIRQLRDQEPKAPIGFTDEEIASLGWYRDADSGRIVGINDQAVEEIIHRNAWRLPVYFAVTVPSENLRGFDREKRLVMEGLVWRLTKDPVPQDVDEERLVRNLNEVFRWGGVLTPDGKLDRSVYRDDNASRLCQNYAAAFIRLGQVYDRRAREYFAAGRESEGRAEIQRAIDILQRAEQFHEGFSSVSISTATLYAQLGDVAKADSVFSDLIAKVLADPYNPEKVDLLPELLWRRGNLRFDHGEYQAAQTDFLSLSEILPDIWEGWDGQARSFAELGQMDKAIAIVDRWLERNPQHEAALEMKRTLASAAPAINGFAPGGAEPDR
jgi:tetratricopeptide (TPR) repeat protein